MPAAREQAFRLRRIDGAEDSHGNPVRAYADPVEIPGGVIFDPGATDEPRMAGHERVTIEPTIYGLYDMDVQPGDRVSVRGETFEAVGVVRRWRAPFAGGARRGSVLTLKAVTG